MCGFNKYEKKLFKCWWLFKLNTISVGDLKKSRTSSSVSSKSLKVFIAICRSARVYLFVGFSIYLQLCMSLAVVDFTDLSWWCGPGQHRFCFGHTGQLALWEAPQPWCWHVKTVSDDHFSSFFLGNQMKAVKQRGENVSEITEICPFLPGEISSLFSVEMLQSLSVSSNTTATSENLFQNSCH